MSKDPTSAANVPLQTLTPAYVEDMRSIFVPWDVDAFPEHYGRGIKTRSADGSKRRIFGGITDDGIPTDIYP